MCAVALLPLVGCEKTPVTPDDPSTEQPGDKPGDEPGEEPAPEVITDWFVTTLGAGEGTGKNWENAMSADQFRAFIAQPVDAEGNQIDAEAHEKAALLDGTTVHLAAGEYFLGGEEMKAVKVEFTNYTKQVVLTILGGYPAGLTEKTTTGRDAAANVTEFTGDFATAIIEIGNQTDVTVNGLTFKNAKLVENGGAVYASAGETGECNLTLTNCKFTGNRNEDSKTGAAIYVVNAAANITDCYFANNYARNGSAINMAAGRGAVVVENCTFEANETANTSGAVQNGGKVAEFKNCTFTKNKAGSWGGGAFHSNGEGATTTFANCQFTENEAPYGGAISLEAATATFNGCTFTKNKGTQLSSKNADGSTTTPNVGGAIALRNAAAVCTLNDCAISENTAIDGCGGAILISKAGAKVTINGGSITNNTSFYHGAAIMSFGDLSIIGTSGSPVNVTGNGTLVVTKAAGNGGVMWLGDGTNTELKNVLFSSNEAGKEENGVADYSNGGVVYAKAAQSLNIDNCEFTANRARNGGCLSMYLGAETVCKITNCNFHDNVCRSGPSKDGNGEAAGNFNGTVAQLATGHAQFENCMFKNNVSNNNSTVLHMNDVCKATFTNCQMIGNRSYNNHALIKMEKAGEVLYMNNCLLEGNIAKSRGMINVGANTAAYLNRVTFKDNTTVDAGSSWGVAIHAGNGSICMNNVTSYNNYNQNLETNVSTVSFNGDGGWLVVNSTIIDKTAAGLFRANGTKKLTLCNNILINAMNPDKLFMLKSAGIYNDKGHNVLSCAGNHDNATLASTNLLSQSAETLAGTYGNGVYSWTNSLTGFTAATAADVYAAIASHTDAEATPGIDNIGADFYNWLKAIGEVTESGDTKMFKDGRGETRTGNYWPGAYQAK